ncbi:MAG: hypothetical protein HY001_00755 [Candidatus Portnoybacteria bacterium]|nr:hypothetical protein [Candidatus Portnoybacteria bacterium]
MSSPEDSSREFQEGQQRVEQKSDRETVREKLKGFLGALRERFGRFGSRRQVNQELMQGVNFEAQLTDAERQQLDTIEATAQEEVQKATESLEQISESGSREEAEMTAIQEMKDAKEPEEVLKSSGNVREAQVVMDNGEKIPQDINEYVKALERESVELGEQIQATLDEISEYQQEGAARPFVKLLFQIREPAEREERWQDIQSRLTGLYNRSALNAKIRYEMQEELWKETGELKNAEQFMENFRQELDSANENLAQMLNKVDGFAPNTKISIYVRGRSVEGYIGDIDYELGNLTLYTKKLDRKVANTIDIRHRNYEGVATTIDIRDIEKVEKIGLGGKIKSALGLGTK